MDLKMENLEADVERERAELHRCIDEYGLLHPATIVQSEKLDLLMVEAQATLEAQRRVA